MKLFYFFLSIICFSTNCFAEMFEFKKCFTTNSSIILAGKDISQPGYKNWEDYVAKKPIIADRIFSINTNSGLITLTVKKDLEEIKKQKDKKLPEVFKGKRIYSPIEQWTYKVTNFAADLVTGYTIDKDTNVEKQIFIDLNKGTILRKEKSLDTNLQYNAEFNASCEILPDNSAANGSSGSSSGTAFFINNKGNLITNHHVVEGCPVSKIIYRGKDYNTKLIAKDKTLDLALLKADIRNNSYINFSSDEAKKMQKIYVAGYPLGKGLSDDLKISSGIVSSLKGFEDNSNEIQIDAPINPGNSGGPIINEDGELIGVAVAGLAKDVTEGINFGIKATVAERFLKLNNLKVKNSFFSSSKSNDQLLNILEDSTVYTFCN